MKGKHIALVVALIILLPTAVKAQPLQLQTVETDGTVYEVVEELEPFTVTTYCPCQKCNGEWTGYPAKNGEPLRAGYTVAVDPNVIPLNTWLYLEGIGIRKACDTGGKVKGQKIDLLIGDCGGMNTYENVRVWVVEGDGNGAD